MIPQSYIQEMIDTENDIKRYLGETPMYLKKHFINYVRNGGQPASIGPVFPILRELLDGAPAPMVYYYALNSVEEATRYFCHPKLRKQLFESAYALFSCEHHTINEVMQGNTFDIFQIHSCMTLFDGLCPNSIFAKVLRRFFNGEKEVDTLHIIQGCILPTNTIWNRILFKIKGLFCQL